VTIDASDGARPAEGAGTHPGSVTNEQALRTLRLRRAELSESISALEQALAAPAPGRVAAWAERVHVALVELSGDFRDHVDIAEGPGGVYRAVVTTTPRLSNEVARLCVEHADTHDLLESLLRASRAAGPQGVDGIRELGTALLLRLIRSRQRNADLVYEAFDYDIGGEA
jgi:hypothetical protein